MVTPYLTQKKDFKLTLNENAKKLFRAIYLEQSQVEKKDSSPKIKVSEVISRLAFFYEKIRNSVDYKEENLLRKNAIERILKREIVIQGSLRFSKAKSFDIAKHVLIELIRAGYLPNNSIPETKIDEISSVISKYLKMKKVVLENVNPSEFLKKGNVNKANEVLNERSEMVGWILALAASDIEERLGRSSVDQNVINYMFDILTKDVESQRDSEISKDLDIQIFVGIHRHYLKFDDEMLSFILLKYFVANWKNISDEELARVSYNLPKIRMAINEQLQHPLRSQLSRLISRYTVFFSILTEVLQENPEEVYGVIKKDPLGFARHIKRVCDARYKSTKKRLWRAAIRSIVYIFITKSVFVFLIELPATKIFNEPINWTALGINIVFPAFLLFLVVLFTRIPGKNNTDKIVDGINEVFFEENKRDEKFKLRKPVKRGAVVNSVFGIIYVLIFFVTIGATVWVLDKIGFNWVSIIIFLFFLAFVSFFSIRIKKGTKELLVVEPKENIFSLLIDFFYVPVVQAGKWLSEKFSKINVFVFILDFIIEAPFKIFIEMIEEWTKYVKERKDEIG